MNERDIINDSVAKLRAFGRAELQDIIGNQGFSSHSPLPDIVFVPKSGPNANVIHFVEFKTWDGDIVPDAIVSGSANQIDRIKRYNTNRSLRTAFSTNAKVKTYWSSKLGKRNIRVLDEVSDADSLAESIVAWSNARDA